MSGGCNDGYRALLAAVIDRAIDDIRCELYCHYLNINYESMKEKAASLYRHELEKEKPDFNIKKRVPMNTKRLTLHKKCHIIKY